MITDYTNINCLISPESHDILERFKSHKRLKNKAVAVDAFIKLFSNEALWGEKIERPK